MAASELPVELWHRISSYCCKADLRALRLSCSGIGAVADEWFMRDITIFFVREDFDTVESIVQNGRIANNVRSVHFQADQLPGTSGYKQWDALRRTLVEMDTRPKTGRYDVEELNELCSTSRGRRLIARERKKRVAFETRKHRKTSLKAAYQHYVELYQDQIRLVMRNRAQLCLQKLFEACPKLESVFVILRDDASPESRSWKASKPLLNTMIEPYGDSSSLSIGARPVIQTMLAAFDASRKLQELEMSPISYQFFKQPDSVMEKLYKVISGIQRLRITINDRFNTDWEGSMDTSSVGLYNIVQQIFLGETTADAARRVLTSFHDGRLVRFLARAESLRQLNIVPPSEVQWWPGQIRLKDIVGNIVWPNLKTLGLCNFSCHTSELTDLILRHSGTLDDLGLGHVEFIKGSWRECFESFAGKLPLLRVADFHGAFGDSTSLEGPLRLSCYCGEDTEYGPHVLCNFTRQVNKYVIEGGAFPEMPRSLSSVHGDSGDDDTVDEDNHSDEASSHSTSNLNGEVMDGD